MCLLCASKCTLLYLNNFVSHFSLKIEFVLKQLLNLAAKVKVT